MRYIDIEHAEPGMIVGRAIYGDNDNILLAKDSVLTKEYITRLFLRGYQGIYIEDEFSNDVVIEDIIPPELRNRGIEAVKRGDIDEIHNVAQIIVDAILNGSSNISLEMVDLRTYDDYTFRHSVNVAVISTIIGIYMGYSDEELRELCLAALLHDIGKVMIDPDIINKPSRLTMEEYRIVQNHPSYSCEILEKNGSISLRVREGVLYHHENENGSGYPEQLIGKKIPTYAKIIHVADVYDALISKRPYKKPFALSEAIEYLMGGCNVLFDSDVVDAFLKVVPVYAKGTEVHLTNGECGIVISNTENPLRPVVRMYEDRREVDLNSDPRYLNVTIMPNTIVESDFAKADFKYGAV